LFEVCPAFPWTVVNRYSGVWCRRGRERERDDERVGRGGVGVGGRDRDEGGDLERKKNKRQKRVAGACSVTFFLTFLENELSFTRLRRARHPAVDPRAGEHNLVASRAFGHSSERHINLPLDNQGADLSR
jgi:hypothetical protein